MPTAVLVPLSEYLGQTYHPDCDYVEGMLQERNVGEISHSETQSALTVYARPHFPHFPGFRTGVEVRVQVKADRFRNPDVTIMRAKPSGRIIMTPPEVAVEVLSPEDRVAPTQEKIDDHLPFGVACVWVIDPETRRAWVHTNDGSREFKDSVLAIPLAAIFAE